MDISFKSKRLRELCESRSIAETELGVEVAALLHARFADLEVVERIFDMPVGKPQVVSRSTRKAIRLELHTTTILWIEANPLDAPLNQSGEIDWSEVTRIQLVELDHNGTTY